MIKFVIGVILFCISQFCFAEIQCKSWMEWKDQSDVRHIFAKKENDALTCLGRIHAKDRFWQMEFFRQVIYGRSAEFFYEKGFIKSDYLLRVLNFPELAENYYQQMNEAEKGAFQVYTNGINAWLSQINEEEKKQLRPFSNWKGWKPLWKPQDTISLILLQSFIQTCESFQDQLRQMEWVKKHGKEKVKNWFFQDSLPWFEPILKLGEYPKKSSASLPEVNGDQKIAQKLVSFFPTSLFGKSAGSNSWVVGPQFSASKKAVLANDPHLALCRPSLWYWVHLQTSQWDAIGATFPGIPYLIGGSNRYVSWGVTNSFLPAAQVSWVSRQELKEVKKVRPVIWMKIWGRFKIPLFWKTFQKTKSNLPILPIKVKGKEDFALVLNWSGFYLKPQDFMGFSKLLKARTVQEAEHTLSLIGIPSWNYLLADVHGGIAYRAFGRIPRILTHTWGVPTRSLKEVEEQMQDKNILTPHEMPHLVQPHRQWIVTANQMQWPSDSILKIEGGQLASLRAFRIAEFIKKNPELTLLDHQRIQNDVQAVDARFLLPGMLYDLENELSQEEKKRVKTVLEVLKAWEKEEWEAHLKSYACGVYRRWVDRILSQEKLTVGALWKRLKEKDSDLKLKPAFFSALKDLKWKLTQLLTSWEKLHVCLFPHLGGKKYRPIPPVPTPGDNHSINLALSNWNGKIYQHDLGPGFRMIVKMSDPPQVYFSLAGYNIDEKNSILFDRWKNGELVLQKFPLQWDNIPPQELRIDQY